MNRPERTAVEPAGPRTVRFLGIRGVPPAHGGFETACAHLGRHLVERGWRVVVYCQVDGRGPLRSDRWEGIDRILVPAGHEGWQGTAVFDLRATRHAARHLDLCITFGYNTAALNLLQRIHGVPNIFNMDGLEWKRRRWGLAKRAALLANERIACRIGDHLIADHPVIQAHLAGHVDPVRITMIPYGAPAVMDAPVEPVRALGLEPGGYSSVVCRPVPENSLLEIIEAFARRPRQHRLVVLGDLDDKHPYHAAVRRAASDEVVFAGAIYDPGTMASLRFHSRTYVHGHTVGGTNPSLVEAMGAGNPVVAHDNEYNRWVAGPGARFFRSVPELATLFDMLLEDQPTLGRMARSSRERHQAEFTWERITDQYEQLLLHHLPR